MIRRVDTLTRIYRCTQYQRIVLNDVRTTMTRKNGKYNILFWLANIIN